jgi:hypothetical protein
MRWAAAYLAGQLILALAQVDDVPEQTVRGPLDVANLYDHLRAHPMNPAKHQRRTEAATAWGRYSERHLVDHQRLKALPQAFQFDDGHTCAGSSCIDKLALRCVVAQEQRPDPMSAALGVTPSDDDKFLPVEALGLEPRTSVGLIPPIGALRYDALQTVFAG